MKTGWVTKRLGDLGEIVRGKGIRRSETVAKGKPCLRYGEIYTNFNYVLDAPCSFVPEQIYHECPHIKYGDVVFSLTGENKEEIAKALAYLGEDEVAAGGDLAIWTNHGCDAKFLAYMMYAPEMIAAKAHASNGDIIVHASVKKMQQIEIPVPPLAEQKRIVAKIDAAFEKIDKLKANAERNLKNAKELFQSALNEAMRPKPGWVEKRLGEIYDVRDGTHDSPKFIADGYPLVTSKNLKNGEIRMDDVKFISRTDYEAINLRSKVDVGDVLMAMIGTIGNPVVVEKEPCFAIKNVALFKVRNGQNPRFLRYVLLTSAVVDKMNFDASGSNQHFVGLKYLRGMVLYFADIDEQRRIVNFLDSLSEKVKSLEHNYTRLIADCAEMRQAVLKEAFEGRL